MSLAVFEPGEVQVKPDGTPFAFLIVRRDGVSMAADTVSELVDELIPVHADLDMDGQFIARVDSLVELAAEKQRADFEARRADFDAASGVDLAEVLGEDGLSAIFADKHFALQFSSKGGWTYPIPLFVLATAYAPVSEVPMPEGKYVIALDPSTERSYLDALSALGIVEVLVNERVLLADEVEATS